MNLLINISQIAIITGDNKYKSKREYLIEFWSKYDNNDFTNCKKETNFIVETDLEIIEKISKKNNIDISSQLKECIQSDNTNDLQNIKNKILNNVGKIDNIEKKELSKSLNNVTNTNFGIKNENDVTKLYENITKFSIIKDDKYRKKNIIKNELFSISIGGKIDGINIDNNCIIEVKNRINKLFYTLRDYEKVQIMCYIYLFSLKKGHLVEAYKKKDKTDINIIEVNYDENYMNYIIEKLYLFGLFFHKFMNNKLLRIYILNNENEEDKIEF